MSTTTKNLASRITKFNNSLGKASASLIIIMVIVQFLIVVFRYVFGYSTIASQELIIYIHGFVIMLAAAYTLNFDGHVRIDILYNNFDEYTRAKVNFYGSLLLLLPFSLAIFYFSFTYVVDSWSILERSQENEGISGVFILKSTLLIFGLTLSLQAIAIAIDTYPMVKLGRKQTN